MLTPSLKLIGAALSMSIGSFTAMLLAGYYLISQYKGIIPFISLIRTVSISSVIYLFSVNIDTSAFTLPLLIIGIFSVYIIALIITKEITNKDLNIVYEILPAKLSSKFRK